MYSLKEEKEEEEKAAGETPSLSSFAPSTFASVPTRNSL